jgi:hypothetical protein
MYVSNQLKKVQKVIIITADPVNDLAELWHIIHNLRRVTLKFDNELGSANKENKKYWERKADEFIETHTKKTQSL